MKKTTRQILMVLIGVYLAYTGFDLTMAVIGSSEKNKWIFLAFALIFLVFGVALIIMNVKAFFQEFYEEKKGTEKELDENKKLETDRCLFAENKEDLQKEQKEDREEDSHCE